jgi:hypothetical protein
VAESETDQTALIETDEDAVEEAKFEIYPHYSGLEVGVRK